MKQLYFHSYKSSTDWQWNEKCKNYTRSIKKDIKSFSKEDGKNVNASSTRRHKLILYTYLCMSEIYCKFADLDCSNYTAEKLLKT